MAVNFARPFVNLHGAPQEFYNVSDPLTITANFTAYNQETRLDAVFLVEVRDSSDVTVLLYAQRDTIPAGGQLHITVPWVPEKQDAYLIKAHAISDLVSPRLLSEPGYWKSMVVEPGARPIIDRVLVGNQTNGLPRILSKTNISNTPIGSSHSYMIVQNDTICIVWLEVPPGIDYDPPGTPPMYRLSHDGGETFSDTTELEGSPDEAFCTNSDYPEYVEPRVKLNQTHDVIYSAGSSYNGNFALGSLIYNGNYSVPLNVSPTLAYTERVKDTLIKAEDSHVYVFWSDIPWGFTERQLFFASSSDYGKHVKTTKLHSSLNGNAVWPTGLHMLARNGTVLLLWSDAIGVSTRSVDDYDWKILCVRSTDGGKTITGLVDLMPDTFEVFDPHLAYSDGALYLIWREYDAEYRSDIFFAKSTDMGMTFR